jgi:hypothetical protein
MADADSVTPGLATLLAQGWDVTEPGEGGRWGGLPPEIPANIAGPLSQMFSTVARLGGRAYIPWSPAIGPSVFGNSDGSGGVPGVGGAVGLLLDASNGWGVPGAPDGLAALKNFTTGWLTSGTGSIVGPTQFSSTGVGGVVPSAAVPFTGGAYYIRIAGDTTCASGLRYTLSAGGAPNVIVTPSAGSFDFTAVLVLTGTDRHFFQNQSAGTTTIDWSRTQIREMVPNTALANALTQATGINKPLLGNGAVPWAGALSFDGNRWMENAGSGPQTSPHWAFATIRSNVSGLNKSFLSLGTGATTAPRVAQFSVNASNRLQVIYNTDAGVSTVLADAVAAPTGFFLADIVSNGTTTTLSKDGVSVGILTPDAGATTTTHKIVGGAFRSATEAFSGDIAGVVVGYSAITAADIAVIRRGLGFLAGTVTS